ESLRSCSRRSPATEPYCLLTPKTETKMMTKTGDMTDSNRNGGAGSMSRGRMALWAGAALLLLVPLIAGAPWSAGDYVFAGVLLFGALGVYEIAVRATTGATYRTGLAMAIVGAFLLLWINAAVGITDSDADILYLVVVAIGIVGAVIVRGRAAGMAR